MAKCYLKCMISLFSAFFLVMGAATTILGYYLKNDLDNEMAIARGVGTVTKLTAGFDVLKMAEDVTGVTDVDNVLTGVMVLGGVIFCLAIMGFFGVCMDCPKTIIAYGVMQAAAGLIQVGLVAVGAMKLQRFQTLNGMSDDERQAMTISALALAIIMAVLMVITACCACCLGSNLKKEEADRRMSMMRLVGVASHPYDRLETDLPVA